MKKANGLELPALDTFPGLLLALTAQSGELPTAPGQPSARRPRSAVCPPLIPTRSTRSNSSNGTIFCGHSTVMVFAACA